MFFQMIKTYFSRRWRNSSELPNYRRFRRFSHMDTEEHELADLRPTVSNVTSNLLQNDSRFAYGPPTAMQQVRALALQQATLINRSRWVSLCCAVVCPILAVAIAGILCLTVGSLQKDATASETMFCSVQAPFQSGLALDFDTLKKPPNATNHAGFYTL